MPNTRPGMQPGETWEQYDERIEREAAAEGMDSYDYKQRIAQETGEAYTPVYPGDGTPSFEPPDPR